MDKEMLDIVNDLSKKPTTELALQIMELSGENLILKQLWKSKWNEWHIRWVNKFERKFKITNCSINKKYDMFSIMDYNSNNF